MSRHRSAFLGCAGRAALVAAALLAAIPQVQAKVNEVKVALQVPMPEKVSLQGMRTLLLTQLVVEEETPGVDLSRELISVLRRDLKRSSDLQPLEGEPPPLPEQPLQELLTNTGFWRRLAETHGADLVVSGSTSYRTADRSGYQQIDAISPVTGQRVRRTVFVQREAFFLDLRLFFLRGSTGELIYEDHLNTQATRQGMGYDRLAALLDLYDQMAEDIVAIVAPHPRVVQRTIFTE